MDWHILFSGDINIQIQPHISCTIEIETSEMPFIVINYFLKNINMVIWKLMVLLKTIIKKFRYFKY